MINKIIASMLPYFPKKFIWIFSKSYISGETINDAMRVSEELNSQGIMVTIDVLGEFIKNLDEAQRNRDEYINLLEVIHRNGINGNVSLKPTSFGLLIDREICYRNIYEVVAKAASLNNFIRIDMEDSPCTDLEIELFRRLKAAFPNNVGLVLQAYLHRTKKDIDNLLELNNEKAPLNIRLCKGIYNESPSIAFKKYEEINDHYIEDLDILLKNKVYAGIATHDKPLIDSACNLLRKYNVPHNMYEFQMLYGVTPKLRESIVKDGHAMRVYVPFGKDWFGYSTRRLKENPQMASHIIKAIFIKG